MKAVVARGLNALEVQEVELDPPKSGEVLIRMAAAGVCHSDLSALNGTIPVEFPMVLGHEGAGVVEAVGEGVTHTKPGDHVVMSFIANCGQCFHCVRHEAYLCQAVTGGLQLDGSSRLHRDGQDLQAFQALGNMAERVVCPGISVVPIDKSIPLNAAALIGCGVTTGVCAALNTAEVQAGSTVAVFGCGGVGLSVIQGARIAGAARVFAVDLSESKLELAKKFGATDIVPPGEDVARLLRKETGKVGVDYAFEAIGNSKVAELAVKVTRRGGKTVIVGVGKMTDSISVNSLLFPLQGKTLCGCMFGSANPSYDFPRLLGLYQRGLLDLDAMVSRTYTIDEAPQAFEDLASGSNARGVIVFD